MNKSKPQTWFCQVPWKSIYVDPHGGIRPCSLYRKDFGNTHRGDEIEQVWNGEQFRKIRRQFIHGEVPKGCESCHIKEAQMGRSHRTDFDKVLQKYSKNDQDLSTVLSQEVVPFDPTHLDLSLANHCNLRCRTCTPWCSSKWMKDYLKLLQLGILEPVANPSDIPHPLAQTAEKFLPLISSSDNLRIIELKGGEPFLAPGHDSFLKQIIATGKSASIDLFYISNGTIFNEDLGPLFEQFNSVTITISVDGTGELFQYLRGEKYRLEVEVEQNMRRFAQIHNVTMNVHFTLSAMNIFGVKEYCDWIENLPKNFIQHWSVGSVSFPEPIRVSMLPKKLRVKALKRIESCADPRLTSIRKILGQVQSGSSETEANNLSKFWNYVSGLDRMRGTDFLKVAPEFSKKNINSHIQK